LNFKDLKEETIGLANQTFSETYEKVFRNYWADNRFVAYAAKTYRNSDPKNGEYQICIPTKSTPDYAMQYSNIIIKVVPSIDQEQAKTLADALHKKCIKPAGLIDSELIVLVALQRHSWTHGFKQVNAEKGGYLTAIFVAGDKGITSTNELWRKLMDKVIMPFYEKRLFKFLEAFNLVHDEDSRPVKLTQLYYRNGFIIERLDMALGLFVKSMSHFINWLHMKQNWFVEQFKAIQITRQAEKKALEHCKPLQLSLKIKSKRELIEKLRRSLENDIKLAKILAENKQLQNESQPSEPSEKYLEYLTARVAKNHGKPQNQPNPIPQIS
jgi:hypothetical protein